MQENRGISKVARVESKLTSWSTVINQYFSWVTEITHAYSLNSYEFLRIPNSREFMNSREFLNSWEFHIPENSTFQGIPEFLRIPQFSRISRIPRIHRIPRIPQSPRITKFLGIQLGEFPNSLNLRIPRKPGESIFRLGLTVARVILTPGYNRPTLC